MTILTLSSVVELEIELIQILLNYSRRSKLLNDLFEYLKRVVMRSSMRLSLKTEGTLVNVRRIFDIFV